MQGAKKEIIIVQLFLITKDQEIFYFGEIQQHPQHEKKIMCNLKISCE